MAQTYDCDDKRLELEAEASEAADNRAAEAQARKPYNLVEQTEGPWKGIVHRTEEMTEAEAHERNARMSGVVLLWISKATMDAARALQASGKVTVRRILV